MKTTLSTPRLADYVAAQINHFFPDNLPTEARTLAKMVPEALKRLRPSIEMNSNRYFRRNDSPHFDHLYADQYAMFLYMLSRVCFETASKPFLLIATKLYLLNKALHSIDTYFEIELPEIFYFAHPVGTVLGRAKYKNYFVVMQNCTVGNIDGDYPEFGEKVVLSSHSAVLGASRLGEGACVGAGTLLIHAKIPAFRTVVGRGKEIVIGKERSEKWRNYFRD